MDSSFDRGNGHLGSTEQGVGASSAGHCFIAPLAALSAQLSWEGFSLSSWVLSPHPAWGAARASGLDVSAQLEGNQMLDTEAHTLG